MTWAPIAAIPKKLGKANCWQILPKVLGNTRRALLYGPPGTGKTHAAATCNVPDGQTVYSVTLTDETPATDLMGRFMLKNDGRGNVEMVWSDGPGIRAWREGARLVINEIDHGGPDVRSFLHVLLDDPITAAITLPTGETVRPQPGFAVVATMNGVPTDLSEALRDRFPVRVHVNDVAPGALALLPEVLQPVARNTTLAVDSEKRVSIRVWLEFAQLAERVHVTTAAHACFGPDAQSVLDLLKIRE